MSSPPALTMFTPRGSAVGAVPTSLHDLSREQLIELVHKLKRDCDLMRKERDQLATSLDAEEEQISNRLMRKVNELRAEKELLAQQVEIEGEKIATGLQRQVTALRQEKVDLENELEAEEESITNRLGRQISELTARNQALQLQLDRALATIAASSSSADHAVGHDDKKARRDE